MTGCVSSDLLTYSPDEWDPAKFEAIVAQHPAAFVVLDCFMDIFKPFPEQDPALAMRGALRGLRTIFAKYGLNGVVVDHAKRGKGTEYYGSGQKLGAIRQMWSLEKLAGKPRVRITCDKASEAEQFAKFEVGLSFTESSVALKYCGTVGDSTKQTKPQEVAQDNQRAEMLARMRARDRPFTRKDFDATGNNEKKDFYELRDRGDIVRVAGKNGKAFLYTTRERNKLQS